MPRRPGAGPALAVVGFAALALVLVAGLWLATRGPSAAEREAAADALVAGIRAGVTVEGAELLATRAIADFGVGNEVRLVLVRIVDELRIEIRLESASDMVLTGPLHACLVGPDPAPDDAGLSDRCWGEPDLGSLLVAELPRDDQGRLRLAAGVPLVVRATIRRGDVRCDYPAGIWHVELTVDAVVAGLPSGAREAPRPTFGVPFVPGEALTLVEERRYCGLASKVFREQGEPPLVGE